jgi:hypothetical protein
MAARASFFLMLALIAFFLNWPPFFWLAPPVVGVTLILSFIRARRMSIEIPKRSKEIPEKAVVSSGHRVVR